LVISLTIKKEKAMSLEQEFVEGDSHIIEEDDRETRTYHNPNLYEAFEDATPDAQALLDALRTNIGRIGFSNLHKINDLTKEGIDAVFHGNDEVMDRVRSTIEYEWPRFRGQVLRNNMRNPGNAPDYLANGFDGAVPSYMMINFVHEVGQEIAEFRIFSAVWPVFAGKTTDAPTIPSARGCDVPLESWFGGLADCLQECSKWVMVALEDDTPLQEQIDWHRRFLLNARAMLKRLEDVKHTPGGVINNSTRRGQGYHSVVGRCMYAIWRHNEALRDLLGKKAANDDLLARLKA
jgi:hypothetical protein